MAWTTPKTNWATGELVTAEDMNAVGENLAALKQPATAVYTTAEKYVLARVLEFTDVDTDNLNLSITTAGGDVLVHFHGSVRLHNDNESAWFDIDVDGTRQGGDDGIIQTFCQKHMTSVASFTRLIQGLSAGSHTFKLQYRKSGRAVDLHAGAQFWVREI